MSESTRSDPRYATYIDLVTYRRDGREVHTPVWPVPLGDRLFVGTTLDSGKVKRLRHNRQVRLAACNYNGKRILGPWYAGTAVQVAPDDPVLEALEDAIRAKYGWLFTLVMWFYWLRGKYSQRTVLEITYAPEQQAAA